MYGCLVTLLSCISLIFYLHHSIGAFPYCFGKKTLWDFGGLYGYMGNDSIQWVFLSRVFFTYWVILRQWLGTTQWWKGSEKNILQICNYDWSVCLSLFIHSLVQKHFIIINVMYFDCMDYGNAFSFQLPSYFKYMRFVLGANNHLKSEPKFHMAWKFNTPPITLEEILSITTMCLWLRCNYCSNQLYICNNYTCH